MPPTDGPGRVSYQDGGSDRGLPGEGLHGQGGGEDKKVWAGQNQHPTHNKNNIENQVQIVKNLPTAKFVMNVMTNLKRVKM